MTGSDRERWLDDYIDALNAGRRLPRSSDDAELDALVAAACAVRRLRRTTTAGTRRDDADVPARIAAALERELRRDPTIGTTRIDRRTMVSDAYDDVRPNGTTRPRDDAPPIPLPARPNQLRQWLQFAAASIAVALVGVVLVVVMRGDESGSSQGGAGQPGDVPIAGNTSVVLTPTKNIASGSNDAAPSAAINETPTGLAILMPTPPVEPSPTGSETTAGPATDVATFTLTPDYGTCEDTIVARGQGFEPGSTVAFYGGPFPGDLFGEVADDAIVDSLGAFEVEIDLGRMIWECRGGEPTHEGQQFTVGASTQVNDTKGGEFRDPGAVAMFTFSRDVPQAVKARAVLPPCGTEIQRVETGLGPAIGPDQAMRACLLSAYQAGKPVEFISHRPSIEGNYITTIYRVLGPGEIEVLIDSTRDPFGAGRWEQSQCAGLSLAADGSLELELEGCSEALPVEGG
jgi:hypothetical protein